jgi:hypothetical protein
MHGQNHIKFMLLQNFCNYLLTDWAQRLRRLEGSSAPVWNMTSLNSRFRVSLILWSFIQYILGLTHDLVIGCRDSMFPGFSQYLQAGDKVFDPLNRTLLASYRSLYIDHSRSTTLMQILISFYYIPLMQPSRLKFPSSFLFHICVHVKQPLPPGDNPIAVNKYYFIIKDTITQYQHVFVFRVIVLF